MRGTEYLFQSNWNGPGTKIGLAGLTGSGSEFSRRIVTEEEEEEGSEEEEGGGRREGGELRF